MREQIRALGTQETVPEAALETYQSFVLPEATAAAEEPSGPSTGTVGIASPVAVGDQ